MFFIHVSDSPPLSVFGILVGSSASVARPLRRSPATAYMHRCGADPRPSLIPAVACKLCPCRSDSVTREGPVAPRVVARPSTDRGAKEERVLAGRATMTSISATENLASPTCGQNTTASHTHRARRVSSGYSTMLGLPGEPSRNHSPLGSILGRGCEMSQARACAARQRASRGTE